MKNLLQDTNMSEKTGSAKLIAELQAIFSIYADDLMTFRTRGTKEYPRTDEDDVPRYKLLYDTEMFDMVVKLLNVSDKIKKLDVAEETDDKPKETKVKNIQDLTLNSVKLKA